MNKQKFMEQLEVLLSKIPQVERDEALHYYSNYFEDAGVDKEDEVIEELGTPEKVAKIIFDEIGQAQNVNLTEVTNTVDANIEGNKSNAKMSKGRKILMICTSIIWAPILFSIWVVILSLIFTMGVLAFTFAIVVLACVIAGLVAIAEGFIHMFLFPAYGFCIIGAGFASVAVGILLLLLTILLVKEVIPGLLKLLMLSYKLPFQPKEEK